MTNQQAPEIYTLHTVPNEGKTPWFGIYALRADAEHDAKVMRDVTGRDWSVVRLVVADTAATPTGPITRYEVVDCIGSKHVPAVIPNGAGPWVRYEDHIAAMVRAQQPAPSAAAMNFDPHAELRKTWQPGQRWQTRTMRHGVWGDWSDTISGRPLWFAHQQYRRHPDEIATQPSTTPQADSQPALPEITAGDRLFLHYNPNTDDIVDWIQRYANAAITADRAARATAEFHPIETAPKDGTRILLHPAVEVNDAWSKGHWSEQQECWIVGGSASGVAHTCWHALPPSPSSADEGGGR